MFAHYIRAFLLIYCITPCESSGRFFGPPGISTEGHLTVVDGWARSCWHTCSTGSRHKAGSPQSSSSPAAARTCQISRVPPSTHHRPSQTQSPEQPRRQRYSKLTNYNKIQTTLERLPQFTHNMIQPDHSWTSTVKHLHLNKPVVDVARDAQCCVHTRRSHTRTSSSKPAVSSASDIPQITRVRNSAFPHSAKYTFPQLVDTQYL